ncbi:MAG: ribosome silencing factor [Deltaproteobacteria bacterium]|nr:ribosome silencing factor [Deltaproteobacteria bacterium]
MDTKSLVLACANAALERKAKDLTILKIKELSSFTDFFIICSGSSDRQVSAIADAVAEKLKKLGILPLGIEGARGGKWVLMDYGDVVVHVFYEPVREFYDIERLWSDAPGMVIDDSEREITALSDELEP